MTKKEMFAKVVEMAMVQGEVEIAEAMKHEIELLEKKTSKASKEKVAEQETVMELIMSALDELGKPATATEITRQLGFEYSVQRITSMLTKLVKAERVAKTEDKKTALFAIAIIK